MLLCIMTAGCSVTTSQEASCYYEKSFALDSFSCQQHRFCSFHRTFHVGQVEQNTVKWYVQVNMPPGTEVDIRMSGRSSQIFSYMPACRSGNCSRKSPREYVHGSASVYLPCAWSSSYFFPYSSPCAPNCMYPVDPYTLKRRLTCTQKDP